MTGSDEQDGTQTYNEYSGLFQYVITLDDLFKEIKGHSEIEVQYARLYGVEGDKVKTVWQKNNQD